MKIGEFKSLYINLATDITTMSMDWLGAIQKRLDTGEISSFVVLVHGKHRVVPDVLAPFAVYPFDGERLVDFVDRICNSHKVTHFVSMRKTILRNICLSTACSNVRVAHRDKWDSVVDWLYDSNPEYWPTKPPFDHKMIGK